MIRLTCVTRLTVLTLQCFFLVLFLLHNLQNLYHYHLEHPRLLLNRSPMKGLSIVGFLELHSNNCHQNANICTYIQLLSRLQILKLYIINLNPRQIFWNLRISALLVKVVNFLKNVDYCKFESLRTRLSKFGENFKNAN